MQDLKLKPIDAKKFYKQEAAKGDCVVMKPSNKGKKSMPMPRD